MLVNVAVNNNWFHRHSTNILLALLRSSFLFLFFFFIWISFHLFRMVGVAHSWNLFIFFNSLLTDIRSLFEYIILSRLVAHLICKHLKWTTEIKQPMLSVRVFGLEFYGRTMCECKCDCKRMFIFIILKLIYRGMEFQRIDSDFKISQVCIQLVTQNMHEYVQNGMFTRRVNIRESVYILMK